jgi:hypothetical protein
MAAVALATTRTWGRSAARRLLLVSAWMLGLGMAAYGALGLLLDGLRLLGIIAVSAAVNWTTVRWHLLLWDPWWLTGGLLFVVAARGFRRRTSDRSRPS